MDDFLSINCLLEFSFNQHINPDFVQPDLKKVVKECWHLMTERDCRVQVQQGSIDTESSSDGYGYSFSTTIAI